MRALAALTLAAILTGTAPAADKGLHVGLATEDITPDIKGKPIFLAGFSPNRKATAIQDKLHARAVVLKDEKHKIALVSLDLIGFFLQDAQKVRDGLKGFDHVLVSSTHSHDGPDTLGLWGTPFRSGTDPEYVKLVVERAIKAVERADKAAIAVTAKIGSVKAPELLHDSRKPIVKHEELVVLQFLDSKGATVGLLVQFNCHPEVMSSKSTLVSGDYVGPTVEWLQKKHNCPVAYFTGTVGGLMTPPREGVKDDKGQELPGGSWERTVRYGQLVGEAADRAVKAAKTITLTPITVKTRPVYLPLDNPVYILAWSTGMLKREGFAWKGDADRAEPLDPKEKGKPMCIRTELGWLQLGQLSVASIPGEVYPELVLDRVADPAAEGADFPKAAIEPSLYKQLPGPHRMLLGLANDEIGYIIPKRQWDVEKPFCYGLKEAQYGEVNSLGPETAPLLCEAFRKLTTR